LQFCILHDTTCIIYLLPEMQKVLPNPIEAEENQESSVQLSLKQQMDLAIQQSMSDDVQPSTSNDYEKSTTAAIKTEFTVFQTSGVRG